MLRLPLSLFTLSILCTSCMGICAQATASAPPATLDGHSLFVDKGCAHCHGPEGAGSQDAPNLHGVTQRLKPEEVRSQIVNGGKSMPAFGDALTPEETDAVIQWLHSLKPLPKSKTNSHHRGS